MTNKSKIAIVAGMLGFVLLLFWLMQSGGKEIEKDSTKKVPAMVSSNWDEYYELTSKDPNGLYFFNYFLKSKLNKGLEVSKIDHIYSLDTLSRASNPSFVFIGDKFVLNPDEVDSILSRVKMGSKLFLAQNNLDKQIYNELFDNIAISYYYSPSARVVTNQSDYLFYRVFQNDTIANKWKGFKNVLPHSLNEHSTLSKIGSLENNIALQYGKGYIYISLNPELYVNYQLKEKAGFNHSKLWLNRFPETESVYWLELGRFKELPPEDDFEDFFDEGNDERDDSYLQFIFQKKSLVYAMILLLAGIFIYIGFRAKRTQPVVPYLDKKKNMTLAFTDTITSIYFADRNPYVLLNVQKRNFYEAVQKHFFVDLSKRKEDKEIITLSQKSNIPVANIKEMIRLFETTEVSKVDENYLIDLAKMQVAFYQKTGMISSRVQAKIEAKEFKLYRNMWISTILLMGGLFTILLGFYYLVQAIGIGIVLWPIGIVLVVIAVLRISRPLVEYTKNELNYYKLLGKKKSFDLSDIYAIETSEKGVKFRFNGGAILVVNYWELNQLDAKQFKRFVGIQNKLKL